MQHTILVIDDQWSMQEFARVVLQSAGYCVLRAKDGMAGLSLARTEHPDAIVMDLRMPECNVIDFLHGLHAERDTVSIPVIFIASDKQETGVLAGMQASYMDCLCKPFPPPALISKVERALQGAQPEQIAV